eukprot:g17651.t1
MLAREQGGDLHRICSDEANFNKGASKLSTFFLNRRLPSTVVDWAFNQVRHTSILTPSPPSCNSSRFPLVFTYHPTSIHIQKIISHLQRDAITRHILPSPSLFTSCRDHSLWDTMVLSSFILNTSPQPHGTFALQLPK